MLQYWQSMIILGTISTADGAQPSSHAARWLGSPFMAPLYETDLFKQASSMLEQSASFVNGINKKFKEGAMEVDSGSSVSVAYYGDLEKTLHGRAHTSARVLRAPRRTHACTRCTSGHC